VGTREERKKCDMFKPFERATMVLLIALAIFVGPASTALAAGTRDFELDYASGRVLAYEAQLMAAKNT
jgi:hypothetical protein